MKKIKVAHVGKYYYPYLGGTENHLYTLANELKGKIDLDIIVANTEFKTSIEESGGLNIYRLACLGSLFSVPLIFSLPIWLKKTKADILHFHLPNPFSIFCYYISKPKGRVIISYHSDILKQRFLNFIFKPMLNNFLKRADCIIVTSPNMIDNSFVLRRFKDKCRVVPLGIDLGLFKFDKKVEEETEKIRLEFGTPLILFVGRLVYYKGIEYLLDAMKNINAKLMLIGDGLLKKRLVKLAVGLGVSNKIIWLGSVENKRLAPYYYACDLFVLPSSFKTEGFGIVQLEAFACKKPVVSTALPTGVVFVNKDGVTGITVPPRDSSSLAIAINKLLSSPELLESYGQNGREILEKEFTKEKMGESILTIYRSIT